MTSKPVVGRVSVDFGRFRSENDLKLHTLLKEFLCLTSDLKAIKLNNVGHI